MKRILTNMAFGTRNKNSRKTELLKEQKQVLTESSPWPVQEAYKALRTNLMFSLPGNESKVIGVTSALKNDGKSINAINMAISFAQLGRKVVLVEADLRMPTVSRKLGCKAVPGLTDVLVGQCCLIDVTQSSQEYRMLSVIPAGNIPPDPTWLLQSNQMKVVLKALRSAYDYIFIDLPPVTRVADAVILAPLLDGYVLVVRDGVTEYRAVVDSLDQLRIAKARVVGFVYNDVDISGGGRYYRKGYYHSSYYKKD